MRKRLCLFGLKIQWGAALPILQLQKLYAGDRMREAAGLDHLLVKVPLPPLLTPRTVSCCWRFSEVCDWIVIYLKGFCPVDCLAVVLYTPIASFLRSFILIELSIFT